MTEQAEAGGDVPATPRVIEGFSALGFFPADHAAVQGGKVYVNGGYWTALRFSAFPAVLPACSIVSIIQVPFHQNQADHAFTLGIEDEDGNPHPLQVEGQFRTSPALEIRYGEPSVISIAVPIHGLGFERPGSYRFVIRIDGDEIARYHFRVVHQVAGPGLR